MQITGKTKNIGIIGDPVEHSISPQMHNKAFEELDINYCYIPFHVKKDELEKAVDSLRSLNICGFNVTVPHKENIMKYLDEIDNKAKIIGAVNTVKNNNGRLIGYNTDAVGFVDSLKLDAKFSSFKKKALLLGAGGAARAISCGLCMSKIAELAITDIDKEKAQALTEHLIKHFDISIKNVFSENEIDDYLNCCNILINATPIGMAPKINESPIDLSRNSGINIFVYDVVYTPPKTKLLKKAESLHLKTSNGLGMLIRQGAAAFKIFTGIKAPFETMKKAALKALKI